MHHVHRRLLTTAARLPAVSPASLPAFPPKEALKTAADKDTFVQQEFNPDAWAALQPAPSTALVAFSHRIGLASLFDSPDTIRQACTHPSFVPLFRQHYPAMDEPKTNARLATLGNSLMGLFAAEHIQAKYPYLPTRVMKAAVTAHVGPMTCEAVAREMGATPLLRWHRGNAKDDTRTLLHSEALASIPRSITGLLYKQRSLLAAREFVHSYFLTREIDIRAMLKFYNPKKALLEMVKKYQREPPKSRLLKETGRFSNSPVFVVGIYSGADKLGEGFGASLSMAEYRAAEDALHRVYLTQRPNELIQLPSSTLVHRQNSIYEPSSAQAKYTAPELVPSEIIYASSGKSGVSLARS
ncbi:54S ribosomal protein L3, mitochondrial [Psilocybe cubensis]|uniref:Large ribosomal subunit protein mL44 n=2 Tax=Psilocybe cubensis TaxID=181762 RepID=A0A8H7XV59_PSICU|nr:54S ribosomal protein L3, mitochondrial [Psilocybe cubensis]KAH9479579.1 54S ribosomal protein L3, mitochondrial [Psilocybe cubensis]